MPETIDTVAESSGASETAAPKEYNIAAKFVRGVASFVDGGLASLPKATQYNWMPYNLAKPPADFVRKYTQLDDASDLEKTINETTKIALESVGEVGEFAASAYSLYTLGAGLFGSSVGWFAPLYLGMKAATNTFSWIVKTLTGNNSYVTNLFVTPPEEPAST